MNAIAAIPPQPAPDLQRRILVEAMICLVSRAICPPDGTFPGVYTRATLDRLETSGLASVTRTAGATAITIMGISARTNGSEYALLSGWIAAARTRIDRQ
ncbi:hypothetical protein [Defluviimonas sp. SAOS-178_SWC]|uniref:hypothetical protein n=1 Tax=Defluviimonas sp. SAOS-178_SWC TaxID=3121287 RepID=UPI0032220FEA